METFFLNEEEKQAVKEIIRLAEKWGYGNLIDRIQWGWDLKMHKQGMPVLFNKQNFTKNLAIKYTGGKI
jgi:hypothetical protein